MKNETFSLDEHVIKTFVSNSFLDHLFVLKKQISTLLLKISREIEMIKYLSFQLVSFFMIVLRVQRFVVTNVISYSNSKRRQT